LAFSLKLTVQVNQELNVRYQTVLKMYGTLEQRLIYVMVLNYVFERVVTTIELWYVILQSYSQFSKLFFTLSTIRTHLFL